MRPGGPRLGAEAILEGDPTYDRQALGAVIAFEPTAGTEVRVSVGDVSAMATPSPIWLSA